MLGHTASREDAKTQRETKRLTGMKGIQGITAKRLGGKTLSPGFRPLSLSSFSSLWRAFRETGPQRTRSARSESRRQPGVPSALSATSAVNRIPEHLRHSRKAAKTQGITRKSVLYQTSTLRPAISAKCRSREIRVSRYCSAREAIQMSFSGMGLPFDRRWSFNFP